MNVTNKTLAILLITAMVFSLGGTLIVLNNDSITGYITGDTDATVDYEISSNVDINFTTDAINFGSGSVVSGDICNIYTDGTANSGCNDFGSIPNQGLVLENIGNTNASITLNFQTAQATFFDQTNGTADIEIKVSDAETGSCTSTSYTSFTAIPQYTTSFQICSNLQEPNLVTGSSIRIDLHLIIDEDVRGTNTMNILADAAQA
jgi:hypothetical protein